MYVHLLIFKGSLLPQHASKYIYSSAAEKKEEKRVTFSPSTDFTIKKLTLK